LKYREYFSYLPKDAEKFTIAYGSFIPYVESITWIKGQRAKYLNLESPEGFYCSSISDIKDDFGELLIKTIYTKPVTIDVDSKAIK
jgi:hypothetical protein